MERQWARSLIVVLTAALAAGAVWKHFMAFPHTWDVRLWDETVYLWAGLDSTVNLPGPYEASGLYSMIYRLLGHVIVDPVNVYLWGGLVIVGSALGALFLALLVVSGLPTVAVIGTTVFLVSGAAMAWPRVTLGALVVLGLWVAAAHRLPLGPKLAAATLAAFLASFMRPEIALSFVLLLAAALAVPLWDGFQHRRFPGAAWVAPLSLVLVLGVLWSVPLPQGGGRAFFAFAQHYAIRTVAEQGLVMDPWIEWKTLTDAAFPGATTLTGAALANPGAFASFLLANLAGIGGALATFFSHFVGNTWGSGLPWRMVAAALFGLAAVAVLGWRLTALRHGWPERHRDLATGAVLLVFALPVLLSCVLINPRGTYSVALLFVALVLTGLMAGAAGARATGPAFWLGPVVALAAVVLTPVSPAVPQSTLEVIQSLRQAGSIGTMAELDGRWCTYLVPPCRFISLDRWSGTPPLSEHLAAEKADALMVSPRLLSISHFAADPWLAAVLAAPAVAGFRVVPLPHKHFLVVRGRGDDVGSRNMGCVQHSCEDSP